MPCAHPTRNQNGHRFRLAAWQPSPIARILGVSSVLLALNSACVPKPSPNERSGRTAAEVLSHPNLRQLLKLTPINGSKAGPTFPPLDGEWWVPFSALPHFKRWLLTPETRALSLFYSCYRRLGPTAVSFQTNVQCTWQRSLRFCCTSAGVSIAPSLLSKCSKFVAPFVKNCSRTEQTLAHTVRSHFTTHPATGLFYIAHFAQKPVAAIDRTARTSAGRKTVYLLFIFSFLFAGKGRKCWHFYEGTFML